MTTGNDITDAINMAEKKAENITNITAKSIDNRIKYSELKEFVMILLESDKNIKTHDECLEKLAPYFAYHGLKSIINDDLTEEDERVFKSQIFFSDKDATKYYLQVTALSLGAHTEYYFEMVAQEPLGVDNFVKFNNEFKHIIKTFNLEIVG